MLSDPRKLSYGIHQNNAFARFKDMSGELVSVEDIDALLIRRTRDFIEPILDFAEFSERANPKLVISDPLASFGRPTSKVESIIRREAKFHQPDTQVVSGPDGIDPATRFPVVAKPSHGAFGEGVEACKDKVSLINHVASLAQKTEHYGYGTLVQQELRKDREYRVMVVDGVGLGCVEKRPADGKSHVGNASQGATFLNYQGPNREDVIDFAVKIATYMEQDISGVDIIQAGDELYVIECNRNPQFQEFDFATQSRSADAIVTMLQKRIALYSATKIEKKKPVEQVTKVRPRVFVGSSSFGLDIASELQFQLRNEADITPWNQGVFQPGDNILASLNEALRKFDYAIFCITPDDWTEIKGQSVFEPRDNVIFEAGLFMGRLGLEKVLLVVNSDEWPSLPSDLNGINVVTWHRHQDGDLRPSLAPAAHDIRRKFGLQ